MICDLCKGGGSLVVVTPKHPSGGWVPCFKCKPTVIKSGYDLAKAAMDDYYHNKIKPKLSAKLGQIFESDGAAFFAEHGPQGSMSLPASVPQSQVEQMMGGPVLRRSGDPAIRKIGDRYCMIIEAAYRRAHA